MTDLAAETIQRAINDYWSGTMSSEYVAGQTAQILQRLKEANFGIFATGGVIYPRPKPPRTTADIIADDMYSQQGFH